MIPESKTISFNENNGSYTVSTGQGDHREIENKNQDNFKTFQDSWRFFQDFLHKNFKTF